MEASKIDDIFIDLITDFSGLIIKVIKGKFLDQDFKLGQSIFDTCPFLEVTLQSLPDSELFVIESMLIVSEGREFNVDLELFKSTENISIIIHNRSNVYKSVNHLNQSRNDLYFLKREIAEKNKELIRLREIADKANAEKSRFFVWWVV